VAITISTAALSTRMTTVARVKSELELTTVDATRDALLAELVDRASAVISSYCHRPFAREALTETLGGHGGIHLQLARTPIATVTTVTQDTSVLTDYSIADPNKGWLYRRDGWAWTAQRYSGIGAGGAWLDQGWPMPRQEEPLFSIEYAAGYVMPGENTTATTISADSTDNSFNDSASGFLSTLLKAGDVITVSGFTGAGATAANRQHVVSGTPTAAKIIVTSTLVSDAAGESVTMTLQSLPADLEKACIEVVKHMYLRRRDDPGVEEKQVGPMRLRFGSAGASTVFSDPQGVPPSVVGLLRPWVRAA
jgi:hypothetical protein